MTEVDVYADPALPYLEKAAKNVAYSFDQDLPLEDGYQEAWEFRIRHPLLTEEAMQAGTLQRIVQDHLRLIAQRNKAARLGFHVDDSHHYSPAEVARLLPSALDMIDTMSPTGSATDDVPGAGDPQGREGFLCSLVDIANAWINTAFRDDERALIDARYISDLNWGEISATYGHEPDECKRRVAVGLRRLVNFLGGWRGKSCPVNCPDCNANDIEEGEQS